MRMRVRLAGGLLGLAVGAAACGGGATSTGSGSGGGSGSSGSHDPVRIASLVYETGPLARKGQQNNLRLAVDEVNKAGGAGGHKLELKLYDIGGLTPQDGRVAAQKALADDPTVMIGPEVSAQTNAFVGLLPQAKVPLINNSEQRETDPGQSKGNKWSFRLQERTDRGIEAIARTIANKVHAKTVVVAATNDDTNKLKVKLITHDLKAKGVKIKKVVTYAPDTTNLTNAALATKGADAVIGLGYPQPEALLAKSMRSNGIDIPIVYDYGAESLVLGHLVSAKALKNTMFLGACEPLATQQVDPVAKKYVQTLQKKYPGSYVYGYYYDAVKIIAKAVRKTGSVDAEKLRSALGTIKDHQGACGTETADSAQNYLHNWVIVKMDGGKESYGGAIKGLTGDYTSKTG
jgi:branched-chain amino acid transport system substrate-binding protein